MDAEFQVRRATGDDSDRVASVHVRTYHETHGRGPGAPTLGLRQAQWRAILESEQGGFCFVVERGEELVGFARGIARDEESLPEYEGELNKIYLLREVQGLGLGKALLCRCAQEFLSPGISSMLLFGDARNPSNGFYDRMGGEKLRTDAGEFHGGYGWRDLRALIEQHCP